MKIQRKILFLLLLAFISTFTGCIKNKSDPERLISYLKNLDSYSARVNIKIVNEKQDIEYNTMQYYDKKYGYRMELGTDRIMVYKGDKIEVTDIKNDVKYSTDRNFDSLFRLSLLGEYVGLIYTNEEAEYSVREIEDKTFQVIGLTIPGNNRNISSVELYADKKSNKPEFIIVYDEKRCEKVRITYSDFVPDAEIDEKLF